MARSFDGFSSQYLSGAPIATAAPLTVAAMVYTGAAGGIAWLGKAGTGDHQFRLGVTGSAKLTFISRSTSEAAATSTGNVPINTWFMAVGVTASATSRFCYINGTKSTENTSSITPSGIDTFRIASHIDTFGSTVYSTLRVASLAVWNVALTDDDVTSLGTSAPYCSPRLIRPDALISCFDLRDNDGDVDWWGQNNLTASGSPTYEQHPPIIYPSGLRYVTQAAAGGGGGGANRRRRSIICGAAT